MAWGKGNKDNAADENAAKVKKTVAKDKKNKPVKGVSVEKRDDQRRDGWG